MHLPSGHGILEHQLTVSRLELGNILRQIVTAIDIIKSQRNYLVSTTLLLYLLYLGYALDMH